MNTLVGYGDESDEDSPRRRSFTMETSEPPPVSNSPVNNSVHSSRGRENTDSDNSPPRPRRNSDMMFDDTDTMFDEPRRYSSFSDSERSDTTEFREPPPPKRKVSSALSLVSYGGGDEDREDAFERADRDAENAGSSSPPSGMVEPRPPERVSQKSDTDDENERLIDMALEEGRNALKQIEDGASTGSGGGWTPRPYDSPLHGVDGDADTRVCFVFLFDCSSI
ncbi:unnamed protein product [Nippostrongylus brasiliensis]|uniref:SIT4 phosphatase-associated protein n=1 Tax=Nippostrongylus brasiliensis TaxID=27835 RepID=A0A0N4YRY6_NIPBR|nr:unnamed protein product [Nippostrongylus brasiliensis]